MVFTGEPQRDVIELPISDVLDINGWELRKALGLLKKGNAKLIELVDAIVVAPALYDAIAQLLVIKRTASEAEYGKPLPAINRFIDQELARLESVLPPRSEEKGYSVLDRLLQATVRS